ncbi:MAG: hypothetical protein JMDDDDMK_01553 [Acidobacteria bacterium]|nr:hypothetical protein [Acidobacteriota bacterium]
MFCTRCGANNLDNDQFCRSCSAPLVKPGGAQSQGASSASAQQSYPYSTSGSGQQQQTPQNYSPYPGYQGYSPAQYGYASQMPSQQGSASGRAVAAMVLSIVSIFTCGPLLSVPGLILGKMEMDAIRRGEAPPAGENFAKAGFYVGIGATAFFCLGILAWVAIVALSAASGSIQ